MIPIKIRSVCVVWGNVTGEDFKNVNKSRSAFGQGNRKLVTESLQKVRDDVTIFKE